MCACIDHLYSEKMVTDSCTLHKMLLVVFFHPRALTQCSYSTNTGSSRASLNCLCQCDTECPTMVCIPVYCSRELFPILDTVVQINDLHVCFVCVCVCVCVCVHCCNFMACNMYNTKQSIIIIMGLISCHRS